MRDKVLNALKKYDMIKKGDTVAVCLSGGADSMALFHFLFSERENLGIKLIALHVNHGLRDESRQEEIFVRDFCRGLGVECRVYRAKMRERPLPAGQSVETRARNARYGFFFSSVGDSGALLATAHTASDRRETTLFNIVRGSSLKGAGGIPPVRDNIIRPLIDCERRDTEGYCRENGIPFVTDRTNFSVEYSRNRIRLEAIPRLSKVNGRAVANISFFAAECREIYTLLSQLSDSLYDESFSGDGFCARALRRAHPAVMKNLIRNILREKGCLTRDAVEKVRRAVSAGSGGGRLAGGNFFSVKSGKLRFYRRRRSFRPPEEKPVLPPCDVRFGGRVFSFRLSGPGEDFSPEGKKHLTNAVNCDKITGNLILRRRKPGDRFTIPGRNVTKTLKKLFSEDGIPREKRALAAVLSDGSGKVIWVSGYGTSRPYLPRRGSGSLIVAEKTQMYGEV